MTPKMVAGLIIKNNKVLLVHNIKHNQLRIEPPGGKVENDEVLKEATVREIKEELGVDVIVKDLFDHQEVTTPEGPFSIYTYFCDIVAGSPKICEPEKISYFSWYNKTDLNVLLKQGHLVDNLLSSIGKVKAAMSDVNK